ncbi:MAG: RNA methyltransferase [bacterium]
MKLEPHLSPLYLALIHSPVYDKNGNVVRTSLTPMDLHDIARAACTYGVQAFYFVNPLASQRALAQMIHDHWDAGFGARYNPNRKEAFGLVRISPDLEDTFRSIRQERGRPPRTVATSARISAPDLDCGKLRELLGREPGQPYLMLFGTGWGLLAETIETADFRLAPIRGPGPYNHLSVRSAVAIFLDRLFGDRAEKSP